MKQIAILKYQIMFNPTEAWSNGYQFENQLADFFAAYGFEAQIIEARGGTGERVIWLERIGMPIPQINTNSKNAIPQIKQIQQKTPPKDFKQFKQVKHNVVQPPKLGFQQPSDSNRKKVRIP